MKLFRFRNWVLGWIVYQKAVHELDNVFFSLLILQALVAMNLVGFETVEAPSFGNNQGLILTYKADRGGLCGWVVNCVEIYREKKTKKG